MRVLSIISVCLVWLLVGNATVGAQTKRQYLEAAEVAFAQKDYHSALTWYKTVADAWPKETAVQFRTAEAARLYNSYLLAEKHYQIVLDQDQGQTLPEAAFLLAGIKQNLGKYDEAANLYRQYQGWRQDKNAECEKEIANCQYAKDAVEHKADIELVSIGINTEFSEFAPVKMGDSLYYSSMNFPIEMEDQASEVLLSRLYTTSNDEIGQMLRMQQVEGNRHIAHTAFDPEGDRMFFSICHNVNVSDYHCDLYVTDRTDQGWGQAHKLPDAVNVPGYSSSQPAFGRLTGGQDVLFYTSDAPGGKGKSDLWVVDISPEGTFGQPRNLAFLNTAEADITPFFHNPSQTLYFSSEGRMRLGGYDIYSTMPDGQAWTDPVALPIPFNSGYNDMYFVMTDDGEYTYLASNRESGGAKYIAPELLACCNDIYRAIDTKPVQLIARTFNKLDGQSLPGASIALYVRKSQDWELVEEKVDPNLYQQEFPLARMREYRLVAQKPGFLPDTLDFDTRDLTLTGQLEKDLFLTPEKLQLEVYTYDVKTRDPLTACKVRLEDITDPASPVLVKEVSNPNGHDFVFGVRPDRIYRVIAMHPGYMDTLATIRTDIIPESGKFRQDLYLRKKRLPEMIPLAVYFDNDIPGRRLFSRSTNISYDETFAPYVARKDEYIQTYMDELPKEMKSQLGAEMEQFFRDTVSRGMLELDLFCAQLAEDLDAGNTVKVTLQGYCSPRAATRYNLLLGYRRAVSIRNYMMSYKDGLFKEAVKKKKLVFEDISYGEEKALSSVSDDLSDERLSIYSAGAARERRAEILKVVVEKP